MCEKIKVVKIVNTCTACPSQWDGLTDDNRQIYVRYRWGSLDIRIGDMGDMSEFGAVRGESIFDWDSDGDGWGGFMSYCELKSIASKFFDFPECENDNVDWQIN